MISNWLYRKYKDQIIKDHKEDLIKAYIDSIQPSFDLSQLDFRFLDSKGRKYYGYNDQLQMSVDRYGKLNEFWIWYSNGLDAKSLDKLLDIANAALEDGVSNMHDKKPVNAIKIGAILNEIRNRKDMIRPLELLFNMLALYIVREDEDPRLFNEKIHLEKVSQFLWEENKGNFFFLNLNEWKTLYSFLTMSEEEWRDYSQTAKIYLNQIGKEMKYLFEK